MADSWVINASPIILLAKAGLIHLLPVLADPLIIPTPVADEVRRGPSGDAGSRWLNESGSRHVQPPVFEPADLASAAIGAGEKSVLSWALAHPVFIAVLDDFAARVLARKLGVPVLGTVGVLLRLKQAGLIDKIKPHLESIRLHGGHLSEALLFEALNRANER